MLFQFMIQRCVIIIVVTIVKSLRHFLKNSFMILYIQILFHLSHSILINQIFDLGDSTVNQSISITHTILKTCDCNPALDVRYVYFYILTAFDRVWHNGLVYKLRGCLHDPASPGYLAWTGRFFMCIYMRRDVIWRLFKQNWVLFSISKWLFIACWSRSTKSIL